METSYEATKALIETVLAAPVWDATKVLNDGLRIKQKSLPQFYEGVSIKLNLRRHQYELAQSSGTAIHFHSGSAESLRFSS